MNNSDLIFARTGLRMLVKRTKNNEQRIIVGYNLLEISSAIRKIKKSIKHEKT
jgi:hypothetical protein